MSNFNKTPNYEELKSRNTKTSLLTGVNPLFALLCNQSSHLVTPMGILLHAKMFCFGDYILGSSYNSSLSLNELSNPTGSMLIEHYQQKSPPKGELFCW
jgi:hypothetical protein